MITAQRVSVYRRYLHACHLFCCGFRYDTMQTLTCSLPRVQGSLLPECLAFVFPRHKGSANYGVLSTVWKSPIGITIGRASSDSSVVWHWKVKGHPRIELLRGHTAMSNFPCGAYAPSCSSPCSAVLLEKLIVSQLVKRFFESEGSLQCSQELVVGFNHEPDESIPYLYPVSLISILVISSSLFVCL
jgi:hypothetical protein